MDYSDIINLQHHISKRHKQMSLHNRAAQFAPFAALTGYEDAIIETARATDQSMELCDDLSSMLDQQLIHLRTSTSKEVQITCFIPDKRKQGGRYDTFNAIVKDVDDIARRIVLSDGRTISIDNIVRLSPVASS